jgi:hypothetical protein
MSAPLLRPKTPELPLGSEEEAREAIERLKQVTIGLLRVPKSELEQRLAEKRQKSRRPKGD